MIRGSQQGSSLVEVCLVCAVVVTMLMAVAGVQRSTTSLLATSTTLGALQEKANTAIGRIASELRWAEDETLLLTSESGSARLDLRVPVGFTSGAPIWSPSIIYRVEPGGIDSNADGVANEFRLVRQQGTVRKVLCEHVSAGGFTATMDGDAVVIALTLAKSDGGRLLRSSAATSVRPRNRGTP